MNERDLDLLLDAWLDIGPTRAPDRVAETAGREARATRQAAPRRWWPARWSRSDAVAGDQPHAWSPPWRLSEMTAFARLAVVGMATVIVVAIVGLYVLPRWLPVGSDRSSAPSVPSSPVTLGSADVGRALDAGAYAVGAPFPQPFVLTLPDGWVVQSLDEGEVVFTAQPEAAYPYLGFFSVRKVYVDPCHPEDGYAGSYLGRPNRDDLEAELTSLAGFQAGPVSSASVGGRTARHFVLSNRIDTEAAECTRRPMLPLFETIGGERPATNGGTAQDIWIVDVPDAYPVLIVGETGATRPEDDRAVIESIISSVGF